MLALIEQRMYLQLLAVKPAKSGLHYYGAPTTVLPRQNLRLQHRLLAKAYSLLGLQSSRHRGSVNNIRRHGSDVYLGMSPVQNGGYQNWRKGGELEQFKAMDRLISRCQVRQCSQMQPGVRVREKRRSRCHSIFTFSYSSYYYSNRIFAHFYSA